MHILSTLFSYFKYLILKIFNLNPIKVYYWKNQLNFGDLLTPALLRFYGYIPIFFYPHRAQLISTGSLIEHINSDYSGIILGTGAIEESTNKQFSKAKILGLRGKLTKKSLNINTEITLGDPGILASKLLKLRSKKKFTIGIIPHYSDFENPVIKQIQQRCPSEIIIINVRNKPNSVLEAIDGCKHILSSSLHGLICSDSLSIPNKWIKLSSLHGGDFKFKDYYSIFNITPNPLILYGNETLNELVLKTNFVDQQKLEIVKTNLEHNFIYLLNIINGN